MFDRLMKFFDKKDQRDPPFEIFFNKDDFCSADDSDYLLKNTVVHRCLSLLSKSVSAVDWNFKDHDLSNQSDFKKIINRPNPFQSRDIFIEELAYNLNVHGVAYVHRVECAGLISIFNLDPSEVKKKVQDGITSHYIYKGDMIGEFDRATLKSDVLEIKLSQGKGSLKPLDIIADSVRLYDAIDRYNITFLNKSTKLSGVLQIDGKPSDQAFQDIREKLNRMTTGSSNAGEVLLLDKACSWIDLNRTASEFNFKDGKELAAKSIAQVFGIPYVLVGIDSDVTFANYKEARMHFWEDTILPIARNIAAELNHWLFDDLKIGVRCDLDSAEAFAPKREMFWKRINESSFLTEEEKRNILGYSGRNV